MKRKSLYLILAVTVAVVTCEPQRSNNDIIWYPVDDEDGVFISTFGEKYRTTPSQKYRSHRIPRYTGNEAPLPLSYDPSENYDPSFFHNIKERRPFVDDNSAVPKVPSSFYNQQYSNFKFNKRPQPQANQIPNNDYQEIIIEVFDFTKNPSVNRYPGNRPTNQWNNQPATGNQNQWNNRPVVGNQNQWNNRPELGNQNQWNNRPVAGSQNQWNNRPVAGNQNQWNNRPVTGSQNQWNNQANQNQWGNNPFFENTNQWGGNQNPGSNQWGGTSGSVIEYPEQRPPALNQWGGTSGSLGTGGRPDTSNQWGSTSGSRPNERPTNTEWIVPPSDTDWPNNRPNESNRPTGESDKLVFPGETSFTTSTPSTTVPIDLIPTDPPTRSPCENMCPVTPEFNPVCGSDGVTYSNAGRLKCAQMCGKNVRLSHHGNCGRTPLVTPLVSNNPKHKFREFW